MRFGAMAGAGGLAAGGAGGDAGAGATGGGGGSAGAPPLGPFGGASPVDEINSSDDDDDPTFTEDMLEIYVSTRPSRTAPWSTPQSNSSSPPRPPMGSFVGRGATSQASAALLRRESW